MLNWDEVWVGVGYLSILNGKPGPCLCSADRYYLCQPLFRLPSPPSSSVVFPLFLRAQSVSCSSSLVFPVFFTAVFCFSLLFLSSAQMQRRQLCCVLKCARLKPLRLASAVGKKIITNPHYRHSSLSLSYFLLPSLCLLILCNEMKNN